MNTLSAALVMAGVLLNAAAQLLLKAGTNAVGRFDFTLANALPVGLKFAAQPYMLAGLSCYAVSLVLWVMALSRVPVSIAYPMLSLGYILNAAAAHWWLGEPITLARAAGIGLIVLGVLIVARS